MRWGSQRAGAARRPWAQRARRPRRPQRPRRQGLPLLLPPRPPRLRAGGRGKAAAVGDIHRFTATTARPRQSIHTRRQQKPPSQALTRQLRGPLLVSRLLFVALRAPALAQHLGDLGHPHLGPLRRRRPQLRLHRFSVLVAVGRARVRRGGEVGRFSMRVRPQRWVGTSGAGGGRRRQLAASRGARAPVQHVGARSPPHSGCACGERGQLGADGAEFKARDSLRQVALRETSSGGVRQRIGIPSALSSGLHERRATLRQRLTPAAAHSLLPFFCQSAVCCLKRHEHSLQNR